MTLSSPQASEFCDKEVQTMYAIIATGGKQYKVSEGDIIKVVKLLLIEKIKD